MTGCRGCRWLLRRDALSLELLALHRTIMVVDVAGFTNPTRTLADQLAVQEGLYRVLHDAFTESGIPWDSCTVEDRGDGAMILIPPEVPKIWVADRFPSRVVAALRRYNAVHSAEASVQLRIGLHSGEVHQNANGVVSQAVNFAFRILDAPAAKLALRQSTAVVAVIASDTFYQDVIRQDPAADPGAYRQISVVVKNLSTEAWLRLTGAPVATEPGTELLVTHPDDQLAPLAEWLSGISVTHLAAIVRRAAGPSVPIPATNNAWVIFRELTDFNAGPDGIPPALLFLRLLADQVGGELKTKLVAWVAAQAGAMQLEGALSERLLAITPVPASPRLHLLIVMEPHGIGRTRYQFSYWRQDDPDVWPPTRGDIRDITIEEFESSVDDVVLDAERAWSEQQATVVLEFLLPRELMSLPVHNWCKEYGSGNPRPLCLDYPIVLRSLERMRARHWHRVWQDRWRSLLEDPSTTRILFGASADAAAPYRVEALLSDPRWVSMVLTEAPGAEPRPGPGADEFTAALRSGLPTLIWHPDATPDALREIVNWLLDGSTLADLVMRTQNARRAVFLPEGGQININLLRGLVVLCDDPRRLVDFDQPVRPPRLRGEPANENQ